MEKCDKTEKDQNAQLFIKLFALSGLGSNYNFYKLQSYQRLFWLRVPKSAD